MELCKSRNRRVSLLLSLFSVYFPEIIYLSSEIATFL